MSFDDLSDAWAFDYTLMFILANKFTYTIAKNSYSPTSEVGVKLS